MIGSITTMDQFTSKFGEMKEITRGLVVAVILLLSVVCQEQHVLQYPVAIRTTLN